MGRARAEETGRTEERRQEVKGRLQSAMLKLLETQPFRDLRIESITDEAGLSRSAFYFYYADKRELLSDAAETAMAAVFEQADRFWHGEGEPEPLIREAVRGGTDLYARHRKLLRIVNEVSTYDEEVEKFWMALIGRFVIATREYIEAEQERGRIDPGLDAEMTAELLVWGSERVLYVLGAIGERPSEDFHEPIAEMWMRVLYPRLYCGDQA